MYKNYIIVIETMSLLTNCNFNNVFCFNSMQNYSLLFICATFFSIFFHNFIYDHKYLDLCQLKKIKHRNIYSK